MKITMKTLLIFAAVLGFQFNTLFAAENFTKSTIITGEINPASFAPVVPMTADFSDGAPVADVTINLAPVTPKEADFEEVKETSNAPDTLELAPVTPRDADFEDNV